MANQKTTEDIRFNKILKESYVDSNEVIKEPPVAISKGLTKANEHIPIVTYGNFRMHQEWKNYITSVPFKIEFLYKNNYLDYHENLMPEEFPVAYKYDGNSYELFISKKEFDLCPNLDSLIETIDQKLNKD